MLSDIICGAGILEFGRIGGQLEFLNLLSGQCDSSDFSRDAKVSKIIPNISGLISRVGKRSLKPSIRSLSVRIFDETSLSVSLCHLLR